MPAQAPAASDCQMEEFGFARKKPARETTDAQKGREPAEAPPARICGQTRGGCVFFHLDPAWAVCLSFLPSDWEFLEGIYQMLTNYKMRITIPLTSQDL